MVHKGIILAGGTGTRLYPMTASVSKQLMPIYDKPMIYYPLSTLMLAGIKDILIITTPQDQLAFIKLLDDGSQWGINIKYAIQPKPEGIAQAFLVGEEWIANQSCVLILGDNIFYGHGFVKNLYKAISLESGAIVFTYWVKDPERYGVLKFDHNDLPCEIYEKPKQFISNWAVTGLYFYDKEVVRHARVLQPSGRGELEITDLNRIYMESHSLDVCKLGRGFAWLDTGTPDTLLQASQFVATLEQRQGLKIACPEEIALHKGWIDGAHVLDLAQKYNNAYGEYLKKIVIM